MKSFASIYTKLQNITGDDNATRLALFKEDINDTHGSILNSYKWPFLETTSDITTIASTARYELPANCEPENILTVITTPDSGTTIYRPTRIFDYDYWEYLQSLNTSKSDIPQFYYTEGNDLLLYPAYSSVNDTITIRFRKNAVEMTLADYTTGIIAAATIATTVITGASTSWLSRKPVLNQYIKITPASGDGDGRWYGVNTIDSDTQITLEKKYLGTTFTGKTLSYTLGQMPLIPSAYHNLLVHRPLALYYESVEEMTTAEKYWTKYDGGYEAGLSKRVGGLLKKMMSELCGTQSGAYFPPEGKIQPISSEAESRNDIIGETW